MGDIFIKLQSIGFGTFMDCIIQIFFDFDFCWVEVGGLAVEANPAQVHSSPKVVPRFYLGGYTSLIFETCFSLVAGAPPESPLVCCLLVMNYIF
mmetsp:Transcript_41705/g.66988  ORF Transcript_41705/g.66988 Transcript_41705/m.66988 type:complete len:94 (-) Transcript_41705:796-1077(-)